MFVFKPLCVEVLSSEDGSGRILLSNLKIQGLNAGWGRKLRALLSLW